MDEQLRQYLHDLSNKLLIVSGKLNKVKKMSLDALLSEEIDKAAKNCELSMEIFAKIKEFISKNNNS